MRYKQIIMTGAALAFARRRVGVSQVALARALEVTPACVRDWERGKRAIPAAAYARLARVIHDARLTQATAEQATRLCHSRH